MFRNEYDYEEAQIHQATSVTTSPLVFSVGLSFFLLSNWKCFLNRITGELLENTVAA